MTTVLRLFLCIYSSFGSIHQLNDDYSNANVVFIKTRLSIQIAYVTLLRNPKFAAILAMEDNIIFGVV